MGLRSVVIAAAAAAALAAAPAAFAAELITIDLPSSGNIDPTKIRFNGADHPKQLKANVLLPDGYTEDREWPVLYLLHGAGESYTTWVRKTKADQVAAKLPAIIVMPDAATGFYTNHWNNGRRGDPGWERYFLDEVIPAVERRFPIRPGRRWHAVAGFSMGGFGSAFLASQRPDYFGSSGPMSGFLAPRRPEMPIAFDQATGQSYQGIYGPADGAYVAGHDPVALAPNLRYTRVFAITGNGTPDPAYPAPLSQSLATGMIGETDLRFHSEDFAAALQAAGADVTLTVLLGIHDHPYWTEHLRRLLAWDPFAPVVDQPEAWTYSTVADRGRAWELSYRFAAPPEVVQTLERTAEGYVARGAGTVELCDRDGRGLRADLPFDGRSLTRPVSVTIADGGRATVRRRDRLRVRLRASEQTTVRLEARAVRGKRSVGLRRASAELAVGRARSVELRLSRSARALLALGSARVRVVARHGTCPDGRWSTASRLLR